MPSGSRPGENRGGGRKPGTKNRATIERELIAAKQIDAAREHKIELAKDVLHRMMALAEGAAAIHRPQTGSDGKVVEGTGDWPLFGDWYDRTVYCAKELAKYQSPTFKAIAVSMPAEQPAPPPKTIDGKVIKINDPMAASRVYAQIMKRSAAA